MSAPSLFDHAAERAALVSGRPVSQERLRVRGTDAAPAGPLLESTPAVVVVGRDVFVGRELHEAAPTGPLCGDADRPAMDWERGVFTLNQGAEPLVHGFATERTFCGLAGGKATTDARQVTCAACAEAAWYAMQGRPGGKMTAAILRVDGRRVQGRKRGAR